jgi:hypothetical protein
VKRELTFLIALALLMNASGPAVAQDKEITDKDLEALTKDEKSTPSNPDEEVQDLDSVDSTPSTQAPAEAQPAETSPAPETTSTQEPVEPAETDTVQVTETPIEPTPAPEEPVTPPSDELEELKADISESDELDEFRPAQSDSPLEAAEAEAAELKTKTEAEAVAKTPEAAEKKESTEPAVFDVGMEERELLTLAQNIQGQISDTEWNEMATTAKVDSYTVVKNDWLFKISKKLFGSGYFYPKIWSLNSFITNPHFIEPGMVLSFTTGSGSSAPQVKLGTFSEDEINAVPGSLGTTNASDLANFGEDVRPKWLEEKDQLEKQGIYFQYASEETMEDLTKAGEQALNREYENYQPPRNEFDVIVPANYDKSGFDKDSKILFTFKEGFYLSTFVSTNIVQDFGEITNGPDENIIFTMKDHAYVKFDDSINPLPGDKFSVYSANGKVEHSNSDRSGYAYAIVGQIKLIRKIKDKWEVEFIEVAGTPQRGDRVTTYTPKIEKITKTYNSRLIEAAVVGSYNAGQTLIGYGDVVYIDRGRADGIEMGNVFEVYGFKDRALGENITDQPTYKLGELAVITLTDNFATAIVNNTTRDFYVGDIAISKTKERYLREQNTKNNEAQTKKELLGGKALEELDVELNLENLNDDLLKQADKIQLTEDELAELERQEREKSVIKDSEKDLKALERLENEIEQAEKVLNDAKLDEDKLLENENLNDLEKKQGSIDQDSLDEIEENLGKRYVDEDLNSKDNPYGLSEFDVEEIDELLNTEKKK